MSQLQKLVRPAARTVSMFGQRGKSDAVVHHEKSAVGPYIHSEFPTYDDLPKIQPGYQEWYSQRNSKYNIVLALGVVSVIGTYVHFEMNRATPIQGRHLPIKDPNNLVLD